MTDARDTNPDAAVPPRIETGFNPLAGALAFVLPGLGHLYRGEVRRGVYAAVGVLGLLLSGLLVGGVDTIDSREDRWWFIGQALVGPVVFMIDAYHQTALKAEGPARIPAPNTVPPRRAAYPDERLETGPSGRRWVVDPADPAAPSTKSIGKVNEIGTLFGLVAGLVNLIVMLDALLPPKRPRELQP